MALVCTQYLDNMFSVSAKTFVLLDVAAWHFVNFFHAVSLDIALDLSPVNSSFRISSDSREDASQCLDGWHCGTSELETIVVRMYPIVC